MCLLRKHKQHLRPQLDGFWVEHLGLGEYIRGWPTILVDTRIGIDEMLNKTNGISCVLTEQLQQGEGTS